MNITSSGRPLGSYPFFKFRDGEGGYFLVLSRVDVSDVRKQPMAEAFYKPLFKFENRDGMYDIQIGNLHIFIARSISFYVDIPHLSEEER
jgi:hypothetical protein